MIEKKSGVVVKIGSTSIDRLPMEEVVEFVSDMHIGGDSCVLVSSGAVSKGEKIVDEYGISYEKKNFSKKLLAGIGQAKLYEEYRELFAERGLLTVQFLVNKLNFPEILWESIFNTVIPIFNGNDIVTNTDLLYRDNESLAKDIMFDMNAKLLIILTDVDGVYTFNPKNNSRAKKYKTINKIPKNLKDLVDMSESRKTSKGGTGGMFTKLFYTREILENGGDVYITNSIEDARNFFFRNLMDDWKGTFISSDCKKNTMY